MRMMLTASRVVLIAAVAVVGVDATADAAEKWTAVRSPNFLVTGNATDGRLHRVARDLEQLRAAFAVLFPGADRESSAGTTVIVFSNDQAFRPFKPLYQDKPANLSGFFVPGSDVNFIALNGEIESPRVIYHEFVHSLTRDATNRLPPWANEGLAEFYSTFTASPKGTSVDLGRPVENHIITLRQKPLMPLRTLLAADQQSAEYNEASKQGIFYAQSWALVHYLVAGKDGARRKQMTQYLSLVADGKPIDESFRAAFQTDYAGLERELREYVRQVTMTFFKVTLDARLDVDSTMKAVQVSEAQAATFLGDLLLHIGRLDAAEMELDRAIALDPELAAGQASMGMLRLRQEKDAEAMEYLTRAVRSDSANHLAHFFYAELLQKLATDDGGDDQQRARFELMRTHLKKSIALSPHFIEAYRVLGLIAVLLRDELDETERALQTAIGYAPGREDLRLGLAEIMGSNGKEQAARAVAAGVRASTTDAAVRREADTLFNELQRKIDSAQALREYQARRDAGQNAASTAEGRLADEPDKPTLPGSAAAPAGSNREQAVRPTPRAAGLRVEGRLTALECANGLTLVVRTDGGIVRLHTDTPDALKFVSYSPTVKDPVTCGAIDPELHVIVVYQRTTDATSLGDPQVVEFHP